MSPEDLSPDASITPAPLTPPEELPAEGSAESTQILVPYQEEQPKTRRGIAPLWHSLLLVAAIIAYSFWGAQQVDQHSDLDKPNPLAPAHHVADASAAKSERDTGADSQRVLRYALSGGMELLVVAWVALGMRIRKVPFRTLFGKWPRGLNGFTMEAGIAGVFWICSMLVLVVVALSWTLVQTQIYKHQVKAEKQAQQQSQSKSPSAGKAEMPSKIKTPEQQQADGIRQLMELAPANGFEIAVWGLLCVVVGFSEELIFRGYLQLQGLELLRNVPVAVLLTSLVFGLAHGYQGLRGMFLITVYGALFSSITLLRRNLFPSMLAHAWHDFGTGLLLALIRSAHLLDHLPKSS